jgi:hypothetical protein
VSRTLRRSFKGKGRCGRPYFACVLSAGRIWGCSKFEAHDRQEAAWLSRRELLGFAQWPPGDLLTDDGAARKWTFHARDFDKTLRPAASSLVMRVGVAPFPRG